MARDALVDELLNDDPVGVWDTPGPKLLADGPGEGAMPGVEGAELVTLAVYPLSLFAARLIPGLLMRGW